MSRRTVTATLVAASALFLASCGGDDDAATGAPLGGDRAGAALRVVAEDISFPSDTYEAGAGDVDVIYENEGSIEHTLLIEGVDDFKLTVTSNGDIDQGSVALDPGEYTIYCDVAGHREAGMEATLEVA